MSALQNMIFKNCVVDQVHITNAIGASEVSSNNVPQWTPNTLFLANFFNDLVAGNIHNEGLDIVSFELRRSRIGEMGSKTLGTLPFDAENPETIEFIDYTAGAGDYIYSIIPFSNSGDAGQASSIQIESDFSGVWMVDKFDNFTLGFDKQWGSKTTFDVTFNEKRIEIQNFSDYPSVYYLPGQHATFAITTLVLPSEWSSKEWAKIMEKIKTRKPMLIKSGSGDLYVCNIHTPVKSTWMVEAHRKSDPMQITLECMEVMSYNAYMEMGE